MVLQGAHMLCRECGRHVNLLLDHIIFQARPFEAKLSPCPSASLLGAGFRPRVQLSLSAPIGTSW